VPSVASDPSVVAHHPLPASRSPSAASENRDQGPFAMLLDTASAPAEPSRSDRADRPDRKDDAAPAADSQPAKDAKDSKETSTKDAKGTTDAKDSETQDSKKTDGKDTADACTDQKTVDALAAAIDAAVAVVPDPAPATTDAVIPAPSTVLADATATPATPVVAPVIAPVTAPTPSVAASEVGEDIAVQAAATGAANPLPVAPKQAGAPQGDAKPQAKTASAVPAAAAPETPTAAPAVTPAKAGQDKDDGAPANPEQAAKPAHHADKPAPAAVTEAAPAQALRADDAAATVKTSIDAVQNLGVTAPTTHANASATAAAAPAMTAGNTPTVPVAGIAVEIAAQAHAGNNRFEIRLDPPELGRIDVRLDIDRDGNVSSRLTVDRADTLDLLRRDASQLERALQQAGLKTADNALEFSLRDQRFTRDDQPSQNAAQLVVPDEDAPPLEALRRGYGQRLGLGGGIDIRV
jgi:flagellar hook-length control protein FliK